MQSVVLAEEKGSTSVYVGAKITDDGDLHMTAHKLGSGAGAFGDETEYSASVRAEDKDRLLLLLLQHVYGGNTRAVDEFYAWAIAKGIEAGWFRWP